MERFFVLLFNPGEEPLFLFKTCDLGLIGRSYTRLRKDGTRRQQNETENFEIPVLTGWSGLLVPESFSFIPSFRLLFNWSVTFGPVESSSGLLLVSVDYHPIQNMKKKKKKKRSLSQTTGLHFHLKPAPS